VICRAGIVVQSIRLFDKPIPSGSFHKSYTVLGAYLTQFYYMLIFEIVCLLAERMLELNSRGTGSWSDLKYHLQNRASCCDGGIDLLDLVGHIFPVSTKCFANIDDLYPQSRHFYPDINRGAYTGSKPTMSTSWAP
jgi:hypothetical protein